MLPHQNGIKIQSIWLSQAYTTFHIIFFTLHEAGVLCNRHAYSAHIVSQLEANAAEKKRFNEILNQNRTLRYSIICISSVSFGWILMSTVTHRNKRWRQYAERFVASFCAHLRHVCTNRNHLFAPIEDDEVSLLFVMCTHITNRFYLFYLHWKPIFAWDLLAFKMMI